MNCPAGVIFVAIQFMERSEKSWRSQFMMRRHQFICKNEQSKNRRNFPFTLALSVVIRVWVWSILYLTSQMRCSHLAVFSNSSLRTSPIYPRRFFLYTLHDFLHPLHDFYLIISFFTPTSESAESKKASADSLRKLSLAIFAEVVLYLLATSKSFSPALG